MNHSKYGQRFSPKHDPKQPAGASVEVPMTSPTVVKINEPAPLDLHGVAVLLASKPAETVGAAAAEASRLRHDTVANEAMVREGSYIRTGIARAVQQPDDTADEEADASAPAPDATTPGETADAPLPLKVAS